MKKVVCEKCDTKRGRRECMKLNKFICGDCCSSTQLNSSCPKKCEHYGKLNTKDLSKKINMLIEMAIGLRIQNPEESIKVFDRALELDEKNSKTLIEKSITYERLGQYDRSIECLKNAYDLSNDSSIYVRIAATYRQAGEIQKSIDMLMNMKDRNERPEAEYLLGECLFIRSQFKDTIECMKRVIENPKVDKQLINNGRVLASRSYLLLKDIDSAIEYANNLEKEYAEQKHEIIESAYLMSGRMYELLCYISSMEDANYRERFMLLQCALVLKKDVKGSIVAVIDDLLHSSYLAEGSLEQVSLIGIKIKLLFKQLNIKQAYEVFQENEEKIIQNSKDNGDLRESSSLIAFFIYSFDRRRAITIFNTILGVEFEELLVDELFKAFSTMDISPYMKAKALVKALELIKDGKNESFNRTAIAADLLFECGEYLQAYDLFNRQIDKDRPDTIIMYKMAICLVKQNKFEEAMQAYQDILLLTKFIPGVYPGIIKCCLELGMDWKDYFKSIELEKLSFIELYELAGEFLVKEFYDKAGCLYNYILEKFKYMDIYSKKMIYHNLAHLYRALKDYSKGIEIISRIPEKYSTYDIKLDLGCLYYDLGELDKAEDIFNNIKETPYGGILGFNKAIINMKRENFSKAIEIFKATIDKTLDDFIKDHPSSTEEYKDILNKLYRNASICFARLENVEDSLLYIEKALNIKNDESTAEILSSIQEAYLNKDRGQNKPYNTIEMLSDSCITVEEDFADNIIRTLDELLKRTYGESPKFLRPEVPVVRSINEFITNEKRVYNKYINSIERSEGTLQRHIDNLMTAFERKIVYGKDKECAVSKDTTVPCEDPLAYSKELMELGDELHNSFEYVQSAEYVMTSLIPYYKAIKILCKYIINPYYKKNIENLPLPGKSGDFKDIGIYSYKVGEDTLYRVDFSYDISCSRYLFEINCHPGIRSEYINFKRHYMPWEKLIWMISGIRKKWDVVDDARAAGLLLLFYSGFKNYLGIESELKGREEIIKLSGDLIRFNNERDYYIRNMMNDEYEFDYINKVNSIRDIAYQCFQGLLKIKRIE